MSIQVFPIWKTLGSNGTYVWQLTHHPAANSQSTDSVMPVGGTFRNLVLKAQTASNANNTITLYKNNSATAITITLANGQTDVSDTTHTASFAAGDLIGFRNVAPGGANQPVCFLTIEFVPDTSGVEIHGMARTGAFPPDPGYLSPYDGLGDGLGTTALAQERIGIAGTFTSMSVYLHANNGAGTSFVLSIYKNGVKQDGAGGTVDTQITVAEGARSNYGSFSLSVSPGDVIYFQADRVGSSGELRTMVYSFIPSSSGNLLAGGNQGGAVNLTASPSWGFLRPLAEDSGTRVAEADAEWWIANQPLTITNLYAETTATVSGGGSINVKLRKNGADTAFSTITLDSSNQTGSSSGILSLATGDRFCVAAQKVGTILSGTGNLQYTFGLVAMQAAGGSIFARRFLHIPWVLNARRTTRDGVKI